MREIKFRGKRVNNGDWVFGCYLKDIDGKSYIITQALGGGSCCSDCGMDYMEMHEVDPKTVGQFTELHDKNGKEIYEGDIFRASAGVVVVVEWEKEGRFLGFTVGCERRIIYVNREPMVEAIGNIYDNPELIKKI